MANMVVDIGNGFYESDSLPFSNQQCVNLYPNMPSVPSMTNSSLFGVAGIRQVATTSSLASDKNRGAWVFGNRPYFVNGQSLYRLDKTVNFDGSASYNLFKLGTIDGEGLCSFADNGNQMMIVTSTGIGYIYQPTASPQLQAISDAGFYANGKAKFVVFVDSYFVVTTDQDVAIISAPNDGLNWNALDYVSAEVDPDGITAPFVFRNQLYLVGSETTESFNNIGGAGVPFQRVNGFVLPKGSKSPYSIINVGSAVYWVGKGVNERPSIMAFDGSNINKISTIAIDNKLQSSDSGSIANCFSWAYSESGHDFVGFTFDNYTFVYDASTGRWHERQSDIRDTKGIRYTQRCRINSVVSSYNALFVGDSQDGRVGIIDRDYYKEYDDILVSYFTTAPLYNMGNSFSLPSIELNCESGVGHRDVPDPKVRMCISRDGAVFENPRTRQLGSQGNRAVRQVWYKNGRVSELAVFKFTVSDAVKRRFYNLSLTFKQGTRGG